MRQFKILLLPVLFCVSVVASAATWQITYPRPFTETDLRSQYPLELLTLALEQTGVKYRLLPSDRIFLQSRALKQLEENREINVVWSMTDENREKNLLPIRIPIYKGLIGWRIFFVKQDMIGHLGQVNSLEGLRQLKAIQGYDWPDTKILQSNGFEVITSKEYQAMFSMLAQSRGDFFPRSLVEIWGEVEGQEMEEDVIVESRLGIRYPTAMYYFVNKRNVTLANLIRNGLEKAITNGQFNELFSKLNRQIIDKANMQNRQFFELENPLLPKATPLAREELWYQQGN